MIDKCSYDEVHSLNVSSLAIVESKTLENFDDFVVPLIRSAVVLFIMHSSCYIVFNRVKLVANVDVWCIDTNKSFEYLCIFLMIKLSRVTCKCSLDPAVSILASIIRVFVHFNFLALSLEVCFRVSKIDEFSSCRSYLCRSRLHRSYWWTRGELELVVLSVLCLELVCLPFNRCCWVIVRRKTV